MIPASKPHVRSQRQRAKLHRAKHRHHSKINPTGKYAKLTKPCMHTKRATARPRQIIANPRCTCKPCSSADVQQHLRQTKRLTKSGENNHNLEQLLANTQRHRYPQNNCKRPRTRMRARWRCKQQRYNGGGSSPTRTQCQQTKASTTTATATMATTYQD